MIGWVCVVIVCPDGVVVVVVWLVTTGVVAIGGGGGGEETTWDSGSDSHPAKSMTALQTITLRAHGIDRLARLRPTGYCVFIHSASTVLTAIGSGAPAF
jgi:hypothetical protein